MERYQDKQVFRKFLEEHGSEYTMRGVNDCECPLALFFRSLGYKKASVSSLVWNEIVAERKVMHDLEPWQEQFVRRLDMTYGYDIVSVGDCLDILDSIDQEEKVS